MLANSQMVLDSARLSLNETETETGTSALCHGDSECGSGKCIGALVGTCNCNSCVDGWPCQEDSACGGFNRCLHQEQSHSDRSPHFILQWSRRQCREVPRIAMQLWIMCLLIDPILSAFLLYIAHIFTE
ncbi:EB domain-containing protein [Caenorhabditis elegans]|uniref:EB domain-containing protein n=1 Tax=Caenorhabditis elegans TaxID=6239 RepID=Q7Z073_CAEEL|nr:EB domain-containing protein [Caenorhabditis elegans]CCD83525.1 EB domain-containing protein [Caenorhabditis elegans]|eukprot:NP_001023501.1 Uncharacterized protein CELE_Y54G2A.36 [Caenorhabditis elegans]